MFPDSPFLFISTGEIDSHAYRAKNLFRDRIEVVPQLVYAVR
jgi:hypothetical protein